MEGRKYLVMRNQRNSSLEFNRQVVEELLSEESRPAQLCFRYNISSSILYCWKKQYSRGKFDNEPIEEAALKDRIEKLGRLVGRLTLEKELLKKGVKEQSQLEAICLEFPVYGYRRVTYQLPKISQSHQGNGYQLAESGVDCRYHLYPYPNWLCLPGGECL